MHFTTIAIIPFKKEMKKELTNDIKLHKNNLIDYLTKKIEKDFNFYNKNIEVEPYKEYLTEIEVSKIASQHKINRSNKDLLLEKIKDWDSDLSSGIDEKGYYIISNKNLAGNFDYWSAFDICLVDDVLQNKDFIIQALFMPDNKYIESEESFFSVDEDNQEAYIAWQDRVRRILKCYSPDSMLLFLDCHI